MNLKCLKNQRRLAEFCTICGEFLEVTVELRPGLRVTVREWAMSAGGVGWAVNNKKQLLK